MYELWREWPDGTYLCIAHRGTMAKIRAALALYYLLPDMGKLVIRCLRY